MNTEILITIINVVLVALFSLLSSKLYVNKKIKKFIPYGVDFADKLTENTNKEKLVKAVSFVEISILDIVPAPFKSIVDYLINSEEIATRIERYLTKRKLDKYKNDNKENE